MRKLVHTSQSVALIRKFCCNCLGCSPLVCFLLISRFNAIVVLKGQKMEKKEGEDAPVVVKVKIKTK